MYTNITYIGPKSLYILYTYIGLFGSLGSGLQDVYRNLPKTSRQRARGFGHKPCQELRVWGDSAVQRRALEALWSLVTT